MGGMRGADRGGGRRHEPQKAFRLLARGSRFTDDRLRSHRGLRGVFVLGNPLVTKKLADKKLLVGTRGSVVGFGLRGEW